MQISVSNHDKATTLKLSGRFDFNAHRDFRSSYEAALNTGGIDELILDMSGVDYLDSSALGMLLLLNERATPGKVKIKVTNCQPTVKMILEVANFNKLINIS
jgi:anti-anti-sigma factor